MESNIGEDIKGKLSTDPELSKIQNEVIEELREPNFWQVFLFGEL